jgi:hypothetical protein
MMPSTPGFDRLSQFSDLDAIALPGLATLTLRMRFDGNRVLFEVVGLGSFEGTLERP